MIIRSPSPMVGFGSFGIGSLDSEYREALAGGYGTAEAWQKFTELGKQYGVWLPIGGAVDAGGAHMFLAGPLGSDSGSPPGLWFSQYPGERFWDYGGHNYNPGTGVLDLAAQTFFHRPFADLIASPLPGHGFSQAVPVVGPGNGATISLHPASAAVSAVAGPAGFSLPGWVWIAAAAGLGALFFFGGSHE